MTPIQMSPFLLPAEPETVIQRCRTALAEHRPAWTMSRICTYGLADKRPGPVTKRVILQRVAADGTAHTGTVDWMDHEKFEGGATLANVIQKRFLSCVSLIDGELDGVNS